MRKNFRGSRLPEPNKDQMYGFLRPLSKIVDSESRDQKWKFFCESCKNEATLKLSRVLGGTQKSCGCAQGGKRLSETHQNAKYWVFVAPDGQVVHGKNLHRLLQDNASMFDPKDLKPFESSPRLNRAFAGLSRLARIPSDGRPPLKSWKGWVAGTLSMVKLSD